MTRSFCRRAILDRKDRKKNSSTRNDAVDVEMVDVSIFWSFFASAELICDSVIAMSSFVLFSKAIHVLRHMSPFMPCIASQDTSTNHLQKITSSSLLLSKLPPHSSSPTGSSSRAVSVATCFAISAAAVSRFFFPCTFLSLHARCLSKQIPDISDIRWLT